MGPTTPFTQRCKALTRERFGLIPFRSPLLRDSLFTFSSSGYLDVSIHPVPSAGPMCSDLGTSALPLVGFPIRTSSDQRLFGTSPRLFAAYRVLRRLLAPRHPPYALCSLVLMLALAMEFPRFVRDVVRTSVERFLRAKKSRRPNISGGVTCGHADRLPLGGYPLGSLNHRKS